MQRALPEMKYILSEQVALRSWHLVPYAYYIKGGRNAKGLKPDEYELLCRCDGTQEIADSPLLQEMIRLGFCRPAKDGDTLSDWQKEKVCDNRYFPAMNWMITGKCKEFLHISEHPYILYLYCSIYQ